MDIKNLKIGVEKEEIWTFENRSYVKLKYYISEIKKKEEKISQEEMNKLFENINNKKERNQNNPLNYAPIKNIKEETKNEVTDSPKNKMNAFLKLVPPSPENQLKLKSKITNNINDISDYSSNSNNNNNYTKKKSGFNINNIIQNDIPMPMIYNETNKDILSNRRLSNISQQDNSLEIIEGIDVNLSATSNLSEIVISFINNNNNNSFKNQYETFCVGIFISGLNSKLNSDDVIIGGDEFLSCCEHKACNLLPSVKSQILEIYLNKNIQNQINISNNTSYMTFPLGIKLCYCCLYDKINKTISNEPSPKKTFFNTIKNQSGEIFYIATLQYYVKYSKEEYNKKFNFDPLQYFISKNPQNTKDKKFIEIHKTLSHLLMNDTVLVPESISLISKNPYFYYMDICLKNLIGLQKEEMNSLINHIINEVPSPLKNKQIEFYLPKSKNPLKLKCLYNTNSIENIAQIDIKQIFNLFSIEMIINIFHFILLEQKICFISNNYTLLSEISYFFSTLIYPLTWVDTFTLIMNFDNVDLFGSLIPFIMGIDEYLLKFCDKKKIFKNNGDIIMIFIDKKHFSLGKNRKKLSKKDIIKDLNLPDLPEKVYKFLMKELKNLQSKSQKLFPNEMNSSIREIFIKAMIILMGDYKNFTFLTDEDIALFNQEAFVNAHGQKDVKFLSEIVKTQTFIQFLYNEKQLKKYENPEENEEKENIESKNKEKIIDNQYKCIDITYFLNMISKNADLINSEQIRKRANSVSNNNNTTNRRNRDSSLNSRGNSYIQSHLNSSFHAKQTQNDQKVYNLTSVNLNNTNTSNISNVNITTGNTVIYKTNKIRKFLLIPYFMTNSFNINRYKIEEYISKNLKKKNLKDVDTNETHCFIINNKREYKFSNIKQSKIYLLNLNNYNNDKINNSNISRSKSLKKKNISNTLEMGVKKSDSLSNLRNINYLKENDNNNKILSQVFKDICTSKKRIDNKKLEQINKILQNSKSKQFFAKLIFPEALISNEENHKQLTSSSYIDFLKIIKIALNNLSENDFEIGRLMTLACFSYYKIEKGENIKYIYEDLIIGAYPCNLWNNDNFWIEFFNYELDDDGYYEINIYFSGFNYENDNEFRLQEAIFTLADIMNRLNLNRNRTKKIIFEMILPKYRISEEKIKEIEMKLS